MNSKEIYPMFSNLDDLGPPDDDEHSLKASSNPATPLTPVTPHTPNTPASHSMSDDTDRSSFSMSMDSGIGSPPGFSMQLSQGQNLHTSQSLMMSTPSNSRSQKAVDHTSKEKHRRERIKGSCDQLRILLPYIRGRKTDMASILEMCVDYLQIINTFMPQALQDEIVEILSKDPNLVPNRESIYNRKSKETKVSTDVLPKMKSNGRAESGNGGASSPSVLGQMEKKSQHFSSLLSNTESLSSVMDVRALAESKGTKRARRMDSSEDTVSDSTALEARLESNGHSDMTGFNSYHTSSMHTKPFQDFEEPGSFGRYISNNVTSHSDGYNTAQQIFNTYSSNKNLALETDTFRPAFSEATMFHYYPSVLSNTISQPRLPYTSTDYVNPNTVLVDSVYNHSLRLKQELSQTISSADSPLSKDDSNFSRL